MGAANERQIIELRWPAIRPEDQVMPTAPGRRPVAARKDAVIIPGYQRPARGRRDRAAGVRDFLLQLPGPGDARDGGVAGKAANRLGRNHSAPLEFAGRRPTDAGQRIDAGLDDDMQPGDDTSSATTTASAA